jgi:ABC-2 type transport system permease protein
LLHDLLIVYRAELARRIRSRPFLIGLIVGGLGIAGVAKLPAFMNAHAAGGQSRIVLAGAPDLTARAAPLLAREYTIAAIVPPATPSMRELQRLGAERFVSLSRDASGLRATVYSTGTPAFDARIFSRLLLPLDLEIAAHVDPATAVRAASFKVDVLSAQRPQSATLIVVKRGITLTLIFFLYLLVVLNSQLTMAGVIEEKTNRIAELLVASIDPIALLYGKILAGATLGLMQMAVWMFCGALAGVTSLPAAGQATVAEFATPFNLAGALAGALFGPVLAWFLFFLIVGLLQFSTLFAGIGSLISRPEDLGSINAAMVLPIIVAFFIAIAALDASNAPVIVASSFIPMIAPFTMFARIAADQPPAWQIGLSAAFNLAALVAIALLAGKLYRVGMLSYGRPPSLRQVWTTLRG